MVRRIILLVACLLPPLGLLIATGCGLFSYPFDGSKALAANTQYIHLTVAIVDQAGRPLDDVEVRVTRLALAANVILPGSYYESKSDAPCRVNKVFTYDSLGNNAIEVTFSKPGYSSCTGRYANADTTLETAPPLAAVRPASPCVNVAKTPNVTVTLRKVATTRP